MNGVNGSNSNSDDRIKYGELIVLGYNGHLKSGDKRRKRSKFVLWKRSVANGVKQSRQYVVPTPLNPYPALDAIQHSITYTESSDKTVIVEYDNDEHTDMFQVGRSSDSAVDFIVKKTKSGRKTISISRIACRIVCDRKDINNVRLYASGFDLSRNILLGEKSIIWKTVNEIDALTTNGILVLNPNGKFHEGNIEPGHWHEVSVCGKLFTLRDTRSSELKGEIIDNSDNILLDGALIDLCGVTLLWRSAEGLNLSPNREYLKMLIEKINYERPICPIGLYTLVFPHSENSISEHVKQPYVYLECGHVQGLHLNKDSNNNRKCPICLKSGVITKLKMGVELSFYVKDEENHLCAFNPCGHVATEKTIKYWSNVAIPYGTNNFEAFCPFCSTLLEDYPGFIKLIFN